ncbi:MAG: AraC family transcriptional regulator [Planctomycetes bacterium]|nr:AraC family transcriptional regulator [Planctomycetota bacterium]
MTWQRVASVRRHDELDARRPLMALSYVLSQGGDYHADVHYELELGVVLRGEMERTSGTHTMVVRRGQVWLCGMWEPHRYRILTGPCEVVVLVVRPQCLAALRFEHAPEHRWLLPFTVPAHQRPQAQGPRRREVIAWAKRMTQATARSASPDRALEQQVLLLELLVILRRDWQVPASIVQDTDQGGRIDRAIQLVFDRHGDVTAIEAARAVGLSRNRFNRMFVELMGDSFAHFAAGYRLGGAAADLVRSDEPLKAIARAWGFTDASHLVRRFRARHGCTPAQYRDRLRSER